MRQPPFHVWVDPTNAWSDPSPGVLLMWRQTDRGWEAWVIYASSYSTGRGSEVGVTQGWMPGHLVCPAEAPRPEVDLSGHRQAGTPQRR